jgi:ATP-dependent Clp protease ATP-binding subunit ClpC
LDEVLVYKPLDRPLVTEIARRLLQKLVDTVMSSRNVELRIEPSVIDLLLTQGGFDSQMGARPMKRAIARLVEAPLAECLLAADVPAVIEVSVESGGVVLSASSNAAD